VACYWALLYANAHHRRISLISCLARRHRRIPHHHTPCHRGLRRSQREGESTRGVCKVITTATAIRRRSRNVRPQLHVHGPHLGAVHRVLLGVSVHVHIRRTRRRVGRRVGGTLSGAAAAPPATPHKSVSARGRVAGGRRLVRARQAHAAQLGHRVSVPGHGQRHVVPVVGNHGNGRRVSPDQRPGLLRLRLVVLLLQGGRRRLLVHRTHRVRLGGPGAIAVHGGLCGGRQSHGYVLVVRVMGVVVRMMAVLVRGIRASASARRSSSCRAQQGVSTEKRTRHKRTKLSQFAGGMQRTIAPFFPTL